MRAAAAALHGEQPGMNSTLRGGPPGGAEATRRQRADSALLPAIQGMVADIAQLRSDVVAIWTAPTGQSDMDMRFQDITTRLI
eukprot:11789403-Alexandrium_andersonii.AAC.1